jgi:hypothetical protein
MAPNKVIIIDDSLPNSAPASIAQKGRKCDCGAGAESGLVLLGVAVRWAEWSRHFLAIEEFKIVLGEERRYECSSI